MLMTTYPRGMIHISLSFAGVKEKATCVSAVVFLASWVDLGDRQRTLEKSRAGVKSDTLITFNLRWVALSVTPARERMYPAIHSRKTSITD